MEGFNVSSGWKNRVTEILGSAFPILLGPMRLITLGEMAAAVSNTGGFGQVAASGLPGDRLRSELELALKQTDRPIGVNIPIYRPNAQEALEIAVEMGIKTITTSAGNPAKMIDRIKEAGLKVFHKVSSESMAKKAEAAGVDGVIAMGFEAGGHIGRENITTMCLVPQLVDALKIPVIASGGIADARGVVAAFALGAEGVEMGTRFVATPECPVPEYFREGVRSAPCDATLLLGKGAMPSRVLKNQLTEYLAARQEGAADKEALKEFDSKYVKLGGDKDTSVMPCGQIAGLIKQIEAIGDIFSSITRDAKTISHRLNTFFNGV